MIELMIGEQCENCPQFEVEQETLHITDATGNSQAEHQLRCKNEEICKRIKEHLQLHNIGKHWADGFRDGFARASERIAEERSEQK